MSPISRQKNIPLRIALWEPLSKLKLFKDRNDLSWKMLSEKIGVPRMSIYRWFNGKPLSKNYYNLIYNINIDLENERKISCCELTSEEILNKLEKFKIKKGSWDKVAKALGMSKCKKTIMRWRKTRTISIGYRKRLYYFFKETIF